MDLIISDWMMPGIDGLKLCRRVRGKNSSWYTFFVFLTALGDKEHLLEGMQASTNDYPAKPLDRKQLRVRLIAASQVNSLRRKLNEQNQQLNGQKAELEEFNLKLYEMSRQAPLTRLGNRLRLHEDLETLSTQMKRYGHVYSTSRLR